MADLSSTKNKSSAKEYKQAVSSFESAAAKKRKIIVAEQKSEGIYIPPSVGSRIVFSFLGKKKVGHEAAVDAEINHRGIKLPDEKGTEGLSAEEKAARVLGAMNRYPKLELLKKHELGVLAARLELAARP